MGTDYDLLIRVVAFGVGVWTAGHYFLGANALEKAPHWVKLILFPSLVMSGIGLCFAAVVYGSGMVFLLAGPLVVVLSIKDYCVWRAGAYMSTALDRQARMKERMRQARNLYMYDITSPVDALSDLVTPAGRGELMESEKRAKERA